MVQRKLHAKASSKYVAYLDQGLAKQTWLKSAEFAWKR